MINVVVEGDSDREMARAIVLVAGRQVNRIIVAGGKSKLDPKIHKYNQASVQFPWVVFRDSDAACPVALRSKLSADITVWQPGFSLRIAHSMSEAWLLADREAFSNFFSVPMNRLPPQPESLPHAKRALLALCAQSRSRGVQRDMTAGTGEAGALYVSQLNEFASTVWRPLVAAENSPSLIRAIRRIQELPETSA
ncbi:MAG TPA: hypothetical protein VNJ54_16595 [Plantibacter sp.]|uniref:hypothetical protein n=1 Tax=unclassified Plantibacter TaxID=2624265 RepID=UPI002C139720|nr:hypothetical protein [Plantibacter sp.]